MGVAFFLLGEKGLAVLQALSPSHCGLVKQVLVGRDKNVQHDFSKEIIATCEKLQLAYTVQNASGYDEADIIFAIGWRWMIQKKQQQQLIIFHDSLLPKYRGFNPLVSALINGDAVAGATALWGGTAYDTGDILAQETIQITYPLKINDAIAKMSGCYQRMAMLLMDKIAGNTELEAYPQDESQASYSLWRDNEDYFIDWNQPAAIISRMVDAVGYPYAGARFLLNEKEYILHDATALDDVVVENRCAGKLIYKSDELPVIVCGSGLLRLNQVTDTEGNPFSFDGKFRIRLK